MTELKTQRTDTTIQDYVDGITDDARRQDIQTLLQIMQRATSQEPTVWNSGAVGFGTFTYKTARGQEGEWFPVGLASRKAAITVYLGLSLDEAQDILNRLGKYTTGKGCIYIKRLSDVDLAVLEELVADAYARIRRTYG